MPTPSTRGVTSAARTSGSLTEGRDVGTLDTLGGVTARMRRVNEALRQVLSEAVPDLKDPRIGFVTVTGVKTTSDLRQATVYVSVLGSERKREASLAGLEAAHAVLQARVARELRLKRTPQLAFEYDPTVERGVRMTRLIDELAPDDSDGSGHDG
jgi:ribosome-binding factor A